MAEYKKNFTLEGITNYILQSLDSYNDKTITVTFETPVTNIIKFDTGNFNQLTTSSYKNITLNILFFGSFESSGVVTCCY